jgi:hypothetical protein
VGGISFTDAPDAGLEPPNDKRGTGLYLSVRKRKRADFCGIWLGLSRRITRLV